MLRFLRIRNLAVIEAVEVEFESGFNVLTGETGAGKSILVEAVGLLLGARASAGLVRTGEAQAAIEAMFEVAPNQEVIIRREVTSQGRSRSFLDGQLATASELKAVAAGLVELHGQHEHQALLDPSTHLPMLDTYAGLDVSAASVATAWERWQVLRSEIDRLTIDDREKAARVEFLLFQLQEIERAALVPGEDLELAAAKRVLANAEKVKRLCEESYATLYESDRSVLAELGRVWRRLAELGEIDPQFLPYLEPRETVKSHFEDLAEHLRRYAASVDSSASRLQSVEDRLALVERLKRKYGPSLEEVIERGAAFASERDRLAGAEDRLHDLRREQAAAMNEYLARATDLSERRRTAAIAFRRDVETSLAELAMQNTRFEMRFNQQDVPQREWGEHGIDQAEFFVSPNPGEDLRPLVRVASGGELSRLMLALKTLGADARRSSSSDSSSVRPHPKTLIFDEVDAGIGGRVAAVVGAQLRKLGERFQVLCITHLPQIAASGTAQFRITKELQAGRTMTLVTRLAAADRIDEIARMIAGPSASVPALATARALLRDSGGEQTSNHKPNRPLRGSGPWPRST